MVKKKTKATKEIPKKETAFPSFVPIALSFIVIALAIVALYVSGALDGTHATPTPVPTPAPTQIPTVPPTQTPIPTAVPTTTPIPTSTPIFCGGIAGLPCPTDFYCQLDGDYPDAGGICVPGPGAEQTPTPLSPKPEDIRSLDVTTDKEIYNPMGLMQVTIRIDSARRISGANISMVGIRSSRGYDYMNKNERISIPPGISEYTFTQGLPSCSACSGVAYGEHQFNVTISYEGVPLKSVIKKIQMQPLE